MLYAWQKRLLGNVVPVKIIFDEAGQFTQQLDAGLWKFTLIGGGGGGALVKNPGTNAIYWARGGVGGTLQAIVNLPFAQEITINVGSFGLSNTNIGGTATGTAGQKTTITGINGVTLEAGFGTGATATQSGYTGTKTAGTQGQNIVIGAKQIIINNNNIITSTTGTASVASQPSRTPTGQKNTNWTTNQTKGQGGDCGWQGKNYLKLNGGLGFVMIENA